MILFLFFLLVYYAPKEHNPAHIHVYYNEFSAVVSILNFDILEGTIPTKQLRLVLAWMEIHQEELLANWTLCQNGEKPFTIESLK